MFSSRREAAQRCLVCRRFRHRLGKRVRRRIVSVAFLNFWLALETKTAKPASRPASKLLDTAFG